MKWNILFLVFLLVSCGNDSVKIPKDVLSEELLIPLMVDIHLGDAIAISEKIVDVKTLNQVKKIYLGEVLEKHNISLSQFESTLAFYRKEPEVFFDIYEKIMIQISSEEALLNGDKEEVKE